MSKKLILFLMVLLFGSTSFLRADEITIGDPTSTTTNNYLPAYSLYNYSFTQQIYTADEIGMSGTISEVTMWLKNPTNYARNLNIYMVETSESSFAGGTAWVTVTESNLVATATLVNGVTDPVATTFTLATPFNYTGEGNLVICVQDNTGSWNSGVAGVVMDCAEDQAIYVYRDAAPYDPANLPSGYTTNKKDVVMLNIQGSTPPPTPTGELVITPNPFELGERPINGWMEPYEVRIVNGGEPVIITASLSNTAGVNAFSMSEDIEDVALDTDEEISFIIDINDNAEPGEYTEEFTLFSVAAERGIVTVPVTSTFYTAGVADIVETAKQLTLSYSGGVAQFSHEPQNLHGNYYGFDQDEVVDAVYMLNIAKDSKISVTGGDLIAIYKKVNDFHPTLATEPVIATLTGVISEEVILAGQYYMIVADEEITTVEGTVEQIPAPEELTALTPVDGEVDVTAPVTLTWEGGENATQYQVLFGTSPTNLPVALDWTMVDETFGSYTVTSLDANTQYFWQIKAKNSNGTVQTERRGFTTTLIAPHDVTADPENIFVDGSTLIKWKHSNGSGFQGELTVADGTATNSYVPVYGLWMDEYTRDEMIYPEAMLEEMQGGTISSLTFYISSAASGPWTGDVFNVYLREVPATTLSQYYTSTDATIVYTGALDGQGTTMTINFTTPYTYDGGNLLIGIEETTCDTWKSCSFYGVEAPTGSAAYGYSTSSLSAVAFNATGFLPKVTFDCGGAKSNRNFLGYNVYYGDVKANTEPIQERQYILSNLPYNVNPGHDVTVTAVYNEGESALSAPVVVNVSGYGTFTGQVTELMSGAPVAGVTIKFMGMDEFDNTVMFEGVTNEYGFYTINNVKAGTYVGEASLEGMEPNYSESTTLAYNTTETVNFVIHEVYKPVLSVYAEEIDPSMSKITWSINTEISNGSKGNRSVESYTVVRRAILKENPIVPAVDSVTLVEGYADTLYADFQWNNMEPGLYEYGVSAIYPSPITDRVNRDDELTVYDGTTTSYYVPMYVAYFDDWAKSQFVIPAEDLAEMAGGTISALKFYTTSYNMPYTTVSPFDFYMKEVDYTTISAYEAKESCQVVYSGTGDFVAEGDGGMITITFDTPYAYNGGNLLVGCENNSDAGYKFIYFYGQEVSGASIAGSNGSNPASAPATQRNFIPKTTFLYEAGGGGGGDDPVTPITWSNVLPKDMDAVVTVNVHKAVGSVEGASVIFHNTFETMPDYVATLDETGTVTFEGFRKGEYELTVRYEGFASDYENEPVRVWNDTVVFESFITEIFTPVDAITVSGTGYARWTAIVPVDRVAEKYHVTVDDVFQGETTDNFMQLEGLEVGRTYEAGVAVVYTTGMSEFVTCTFTYIGCDAVDPQVVNLEATNEPGDRNVILTWNGATPPTPTPPTPTPPTPPTPPTGGWTEGFENGMPAGWNVIDANNDGWTWCLTSAIPSTWTYYAAISLDWYRTGSNAICSGSFINGVGALSPDEYLVTAQVAPTAGSTFSFYAAACDAGYPADHFGVFVSSNGTSDWQMINEWTLTAKSGAANGGRESRDGEGAKLGTWHNYSVDLSSYAGQNIYIAIRHFNCYDQYIMCVDDLEFTADAKSNATLAAAGKGFGAINYDRDGNWYFYDNGTNYDAIGLQSGGGFYWGIMFPAGTIDGNRLTKVSYFDPTASAGTVTIYQGGTSAPGTSLYSQSYTTTGSDQVVEIEMAEPVEIDAEQNIWVIMHNTSGQYVASYDGASPGQTNGSWLSTDGSIWYESLYSATSGSYGGNWNIRAYIESGSTPATAIIPNKFNIFFDGDIVGASANPTFTYEAPDFEEHNYAVMWVDANYNMSCLVDIDYAAENLGMAEEGIINAIYPNPTSADLHINAMAMRHISIYNAMGQMVYDQDVNADEIVLNMGQYETGVYMINVVTENGSSVKRVTVAK